MCIRDRHSESDGCVTLLRVLCRGAAGGAAARTLSNLDRTTISHNFDDGELGPFYQCALFLLSLLYPCSRPEACCEDIYACCPSPPTPLTHLLFSQGAIYAVR